MNLSTIDEDTAFECLGTCTLDYKNSKLLQHDVEWNYDRYILPMIENDSRKIQALFNNASKYETNEYDTHILFATEFYSPSVNIIGLFEWHGTEIDPRFCKISEIFFLN